MTFPRPFDLISAARHLRKDPGIPWLAKRNGEALIALNGSILALHLPSATASGPGHLMIDGRGEAAFITQSGVCWEIGDLAGAIAETHHGADGFLQIYLSEPTVLHLSLPPEEGERFWSLLQLATTNQPDSTDQVSAKETEVPPFRRKDRAIDESQVAMAFPASVQPPAGMRIEDFLLSTALGRSGNSHIEPEDLNSYIEAQYAYVIGISDDQSLLAWGPALIRTTEDDRERKGTVVVTPASMLAFWQPGRTSLIHTFQGNHTAVVSTVSPDLFTVISEWKIAEYANNDGKFMVGNAPVSLKAHITRDGHENRRALSWLYTLRHFMEPASGPSQKGVPDPGGFDNPGTKL